MMDVGLFRNEIQARLGRIVSAVPIEKGFSDDRKFRLTIGGRDCLLRLSKRNGSAGAQQAFAIMEQLHQSGVRCNEPVMLLVDEPRGVVCRLYGYLAGVDAEDNIGRLPEPDQYRIGVEAGRDLRRINRLQRDTADWKRRKWEKHRRYLERYLQLGCRFQHDERVIRFIETHYDPTEAEKDRLQHDDFHLGNLILDHRSYGGVLDFDRFDWGDPLHEFVKLEWFTWPVSEAFARGQIEGYFGTRSIDEARCLPIAVYIAMSLFATVVWTLRFHAHTWPTIEARMLSILKNFEYFDSVRPLWAA